MTHVKLIKVAGNGKVRNWKEGDKGYVRTAKLTFGSGAIRAQQLLLSNPSGNGVGGGAGVLGKSALDIMVEEIEHNRAFWHAINDILELCMRRETDAAKWSPRVKKLSGLTMLGGATMIGLSIAAVIVTGGAAAGLIGAFVIASSVTTTVTSIGSSCAAQKLKSSAGYIDKPGLKSTAAKGVAKAASAALAKPEIISRVVEHHFSGQSGNTAKEVATLAAAKKSAQHSLGMAATGAGGAYQVYGGYKNYRVGRKINPMTAWDSVDWKEIVGALTNDYIKLQEARDTFPAAAHEIQKFIHYRTKFLPEAEAELSSLIGKIHKAISLSKNWRKGHISVTQISKPKGAPSQMAGISWDNYISPPKLIESSNTQATIPLAEAQRRFRIQG